MYLTYQLALDTFITSNTIIKVNANGDAVRLISNAYYSDPDHSLFVDASV